MAALEGLVGGARVAPLSILVSDLNEGASCPAVPSTCSPGRVRLRSQAALLPNSEVHLIPTRPPAAPSMRSPRTTFQSTGALSQGNVDASAAVEDGSSRSSAAHAVARISGCADVVRAASSTNPMFPAPHLASRALSTMCSHACSCAHSRHRHCRGRCRSSRPPLAAHPPRASRRFCASRRSCASRRWRCGRSPRRASCAARTVRSASTRR